MTNHQHDRALQRQARRLASSTGTNYTAALRQLAGRFRGGLFGPRISLEEIVAAAAAFHDLGDTGLFDPT